MERTEVSEQELQVFKVLKAQHDRWLSNRQLAELVEGVAPRTVRAVTHKLVGLNLVDQAEVFPGHRFRLSDKAQKRNRAYWDRLHVAAEVAGIGL